jgi:hypothetical protein
LSIPGSFIASFNMPPRTNEFQKLVYLVRTHVAAGATVTESAELVDRSTGTKREVDVCIEGTVGGVHTIISIECTALDRVADVIWVEQKINKHDFLPTDVLILYSRSGFTPTAIDKAKFYNKRIVALRSLDDAAAEGLFGGASSFWFKAYTLAPTKVVIRVEESHGLPAEDVIMSPDHIVFTPQGEEIGIVKELIEIVLNSPSTRSELIERGDPSHKGFDLGASPPLWNGEPCCLQKNDEDPPILRSIKLITVVGDANFAISEFPIQHGKLGDTTVAWGAGMFQGKEALLVASRDDSDNTKVSLAYAKKDKPKPSKKAKIVKRK